MGEALSKAYRVAGEHAALAMLIVGGIGDLTEVGRLMARLTDAHSRRLALLGLSA